MDFIIKRNLHQITPYIHFQHSDYGATLRPTEVKPKLDRYLIEIFSKNSENYVQELKDKKWFVGISTALNYKMKITAPSESENVLTNESELEIRAAEYLYEQRSNGRIITLSDARKALVSATKNHSFYFANMVSTTLSNCRDLRNVTTNRLKQMVEEHIEAVKSSFKESVMYSQPLKLEIVCLNEKLRELIENNIDSFFITHNFGCRQTKGFGSFVTEDFHGNDLNFYKTKISAFGKPFFYFKACSSNGRNLATYTDALNQALTVYSIMKAGMNRTGLKRDDQTDKYFYKNSNAYIKGYSMRPYLPDESGSEKSMIKGKILNKPIPLRFRPGVTDREPTNHNGYTSYTFMRGILGLTDSYKFDDKRRRGTITVVHLPDPQINNNTVCVSIKDIEKKNDACIQRFPSPVLIKIIKDNVFFIFNDSYEKMLGKSFVFLSEGDLREIERNGHKNISLEQLITTPSGFDPQTFIDGFIEYFMEERRKLQNFPYPFNSAQNITLEGGNLNG